MRKFVNVILQTGKMKYITSILNRKIITKYELKRTIFKNRESPATRPCCARSWFYGRNRYSHPCHFAIAKAFWVTAKTHSRN